MKKLVIISIIIVVMLGIVLAVVLGKKSKMESVKQPQDVLQIADFNIENRVCLRQDNAIYVGNSLKELENGFCDIKIQNTTYGITIDLNKLWYETYGEDYIQDEYLAKICREITYRINVQNDSEQFEYLLYKYIKDNYMKVRQQENVQEIATDTINLKLELAEGIVKLKIRGS